MTDVLAGPVADLDEYPTTHEMSHVYAEGSGGGFIVLGDPGCHEKYPPGIKEKRHFSERIPPASQAGRRVGEKYMEVAAAVYADMHAHA